MIGCKYLSSIIGTFYLFLFSWYLLGVCLGLYVFGLCRAVFLLMLIIIIMIYLFILRLKLELWSFLVPVFTITFPFLVNKSIRKVFRKTSLDFSRKVSLLASTCYPKFGWWDSVFQVLVKHSISVDPTFTEFNSRLNYEIYLVVYLPKFAI